MDPLVSFLDRVRGGGCGISGVVDGNAELGHLLRFGSSLDESGVIDHLEVEGYQDCVFEAMDDFCKLIVVPDYRRFAYWASGSFGSTGGTGSTGTETFGHIWIFYWRLSAGVPDAVLLKGDEPTLGLLDFERFGERRVAKLFSHGKKKKLVTVLIEILLGRDGQTTRSR